MNISDVPTIKELSEKVQMVIIPVKGEYIARLDEKRKTVKPLSVNVMVPAKHNISDIKRAVIMHMEKERPYDDYVSVRTWMQTGPARKTDATKVLAETYTQNDLDRFEKLRHEAAAEAARKASIYNAGGWHSPSMGIDSTEYGDDGLPPLIK